MTTSILVVEDNVDNRRIVRDLLTSVGYTVLEATTGTEGVQTTSRITRRSFSWICVYQASMAMKPPSYQSPGGAGAHSHYCGDVVCLERR